MTAFAELRIDGLRREISRLASEIREERRLAETREARLQHALEVVTEYRAAIEVLDAIDEVERILASRSRA